MCFSLHFAKQLNAGSHVSLFMNPVLLRVKLPRWFLQIPSARSGLPDTSHSERTGLAHSVWTLTKSMTLYRSLCEQALLCSHTVRKYVSLQWKMPCTSCDIYWTHSKVLYYVCNHNSYFYLRWKNL